jgi:hypothetical protein
MPRGVNGSGASERRAVPIGELQRPHAWRRERGFHLGELAVRGASAIRPVEASFEFRAAFNATATRMMTAVLKNQQAASEYV